MVFNRIVAVDDTGLTKESIEYIKSKSEKSAVFYYTDPQNMEETIERIGDADCILLSWRAKLDKELFEKCPNLKYIGLCATNYLNIDVEEAQKRGIVISNVSGYADKAAAEFIYAELICLARGMGEYQWKEIQTELAGKKLGIIGLGAVGKEVAKIGLGFGMDVSYNSKTRKPEFEEKGLTYMQLGDLIQNSDIISLHVPRDTIIFSKKEFDIIPKDTILIDTCVGRVFDEKNFMDWISKGDNYAIFDNAVSKSYHQFKDLPNVIFSEKIGGLTKEAIERLSKTVIENLEAYLEDHPSNVVTS